jgi:ABC-type multidrug transport system fused ATPase/permease subunit
MDLIRIGLADLRDKITIIPQESTLFENTLRFNLDPEDKCTDAEIMELINKASLTDLVLNNEHGLGRPITMKGDNLSSGEKQLICICRAILRVSSYSYHRKTKSS